jgi:hypothetical protein
VAKVESYRSLILLPRRSSASRSSRLRRARRVARRPGLRAPGPSLKVNGGLLGHPESTVQDSVARRASGSSSSCNENFDALIRHLVSWADLCNLGDLSVLAALVGGDGLAEKAGWDLSWVLDPKGYPVIEMKAPTSAAVLCNYTTNGNNALFLTGGIWIKPAEWAAKRAPDDKLASKASRPEEGWASTRK